MEIKVMAIRTSYADQPQQKGQVANFKRTIDRISDNEPQMRKVFEKIDTVDRLVKKENPYVAIAWAVAKLALGLVAMVVLHLSVIGVIAGAVLVVDAMRDAVNAGKSIYYKGDVHKEVTEPAKFRAFGQAADEFPLLEINTEEPLSHASKAGAAESYSW